MKKVLSVIIVIALLFTQFVLPAFAMDENIVIENVTVTANRDLVAYYDGSWDVEYDDDENEIDVFYYDTTNADLWFEIEMAEDETFSGDMWDVSSFLDATMVYELITCYDENHIGTYEVEISCEYFTTTVEINVVENPVESVEAEARATLIENWNGEWITYCEDGECVEYFNYDIYQAYPYYTITYKDGTIYEGNEEEIWEQTGYYPYDIDNQFDNPWEIGKNTAKATFLGVECEYEVEVVETPIESIEAEATFPLYENYSGYWAENDDEGKDYFVYSVMDALPVFTVTFKDGTVIEGTADQIAYETEEYPLVTDDQQENPWSLGENVADVNFMGIEAQFTVEIVKDNVVSITGEPMTYLIENYNGFWENYIDENENETKYFSYYVYDAEPMFTITYEDGSTFTGTDEEIYGKTGVWTYDETEQYLKPWSVGENTANMSYLGHAFEVTFEVVESPVESVVLIEENGLTIEIKYKDDETATKEKAIDFLVEMVGWEYKTYIITVNGMIECEIYANGDEEAQEFYISVLGVESNKLDNCDWLNAVMCANEVAYSSLIYATGSEELYDKKFAGYNSADENQDLTQMVALAAYLCEYDPEIDEPYYHHNLGTDVINEDLALVFGVTLEDFTGVNGYDAETGMVEIFEPMESAYEFETKDMNFVDGKWEKVYRVVEVESGDVEILKVVLNEEMTIDKILFRTFGDVNGDGKVTAFDARQILQYVAMMKDFDESQLLAADITGDGKIGAIDARGVLQYAAGMKEF
ncbi:MAG: hypothetical protein IKV25_06185 [Clostridia bacterium]|nr:hypothetical protein [Clostridia bacterium]